MEIEIDPKWRKTHRKTIMLFLHFAQTNMLAIILCKQRINWCSLWFKKKIPTWIASRPPHMKTAIWAQRIRELKVKTWEGRYKIDRLVVNLGDITREVADRIVGEWTGGHGCGWRWRRRARKDGMPDQRVERDGHPPPSQDACWVLLLDSDINKHKLLAPGYLNSDGEEMKRWGGKMEARWRGTEEK